MPESKTPMGARIAERHHADPTPTSDAPCRSGRTRQPDLRRHVPEVRGDERVGAGEEMIGDEQRDPVLDVRRSRPDVSHRRSAAARRFDAGSAAVGSTYDDDRASRCRMRRASCTSAADSRIIAMLIASTKHEERAAAL